VEDDGESEAWRTGEQGRWNVSIESAAQSLFLSITCEGRMPDEQSHVQVLIPACETRALACVDVEFVTEETRGGWRYVTVRVPRA